jgi:hypothetical protein
MDKVVATGQLRDIARTHEVEFITVAEIIL